jgi:hypothetical protein
VWLAYDAAVPWLGWPGALGTRFPLSDAILAVFSRFDEAVFRLVLNSHSTNKAFREGFRPRIRVE